MIITPLGHTEFLIDIKNSNDENVRILVDTWLSDFAVGDLMERTVKVELDREKISTIDAIYISHAHTDHFDPYTLVEIYGSCHSEKVNSSAGGREATLGCEGRICPDSGEKLSRSFVPQDDKSKKPILLLPFTLSYLVPLIHEYLGDISIEILFPGKTFVLRGIEVTGHMFSQSTITNEDDVMMLAVANADELLFAEIDTVPEDDDEDVQNVLYRILTQKEYTTVCYLASRNILDAALPVLDLPAKRRKGFRAEYIATQKDAMYAAYQKYEYEDFASFENIYTIPGLVRGFIGQGIAYPDVLSEDFHTLSLFPLEEIASMESDIARECGYEFPQRALLPGRQYRAENGALEVGRKECSIATLKTQNVKGNLETPDMRLYATGPLFPRSLTSDDIEDAKKRILEVLNIRFLPYWSASPIASLRDALIKNQGTYRILFSVTREDETIQQNKNKFLNDSGLLPTQEGQEQQKISFEYSTARAGFIEILYTPDIRIDEEYYLTDVLDFLDGRQELYSNFWHRLDPKKIYRLWTCIGANFCNNELVINKYRLHFERAIAGETSTTFFEEIKKILKP